MLASRSLLQQQPPAPRERLPAGSWRSQLRLALMAAHQQHVVHRHVMSSGQLALRTVSSARALCAATAGRALAGTNSFALASSASSCMTAIHVGHCQFSQPDAAQQLSPIIQHRAWGPASAVWRLLLHLGWQLHTGPRWEHYIALPCLDCLGRAVSTPTWSAKRQLSFSQEVPATCFLGRNAKTCSSAHVCMSLEDRMQAAPLDEHRHEAHPPCGCTPSRGGASPLDGRSRSNPRCARCRARRCPRLTAGTRRASPHAACPPGWWIPS